MTNGLKVTIAGLDFYGHGYHDFVISPDGFGGWDDGVDMRLENTARPYAHGSFNLPTFQDARTVAISGNVLADSPRKLVSLSDRFTGLLAGGQQGRIQVEKYGVVRWADCRLASKPMFTERGGQNSASFQIQVWCPDPRKFGNSRDFVGSAPADVAVYHRGNYDAYPTVVLRGSAPSGYDLWGPDGRRYTVTRALVSGHPHRVEFNDGGLRVDGVLMPNTGQSDVWAVPPGQSIIFGVSAASGSVEATITVTDTYI